MKHRPHVPKKGPKRMGWLVYCKHCGIVYLRNEATQRALKLPCKDNDSEET